MPGDTVTSDEEFLLARIPRCEQPGLHTCKHMRMHARTGCQFASLGSERASMRHSGLGVENTLSVHYLLHPLYLKPCKE